MSDRDPLPSHDASALLSQPHVKALKLAVVAMGVLIFVGLAVIVARLIYLASGSGTAAPATVNAIAAEGQISLPGDARVTQMTMSDNRLALHYKAKDRSGLVILDLRTGRQISHIRIGSQPTN